jgi:L-serine dehydratase
MKSLDKLYRFGPGPSSSHTIAPANAAASFLRFSEAAQPDAFAVTLYGSLALTGKGHKTDKSISQALLPFPTSFAFDLKTRKPHPNTMLFIALKQGQEVRRAEYVSLGGGELLSDDDPSVNDKDIYPYRSLDEIKAYVAANAIPSSREFCLLYEDPAIVGYLETAVQKMFAAVERGLKAQGSLSVEGNPKLCLKRTAKGIYETALAIPEEEARREMLISAYAYAVMEGNACGEEVVTAPTCGSSGVLPAVLYYEYHDKGVSLDRIRDALFTGGLFGNLVKQNASISGAIGGCQAEIGTAASMAAAALSALDGLSLYQEEYAAECAMEHFLGLSCDPVDGYVIIPCIERNGMGALRAYDSYLYAKYISPLRKNSVSFDNVVKAMKLTGDALGSAYKETAEGGLAEILKGQE